MGLICFIRVGYIRELDSDIGYSSSAGQGWVFLDWSSFVRDRWRVEYVSRRKVEFSYGRLRSEFGSEVFDSK